MNEIKILVTFESDESREIGETHGEIAYGYDPDNALDNFENQCRESNVKILSWEYADSFPSQPRRNRV